MLSINHSENVDAAVQYFKLSLAVEDYYSDKREITGQWHGNTAERIGLSGDVKERDFEALLYNHDPITGEKLTPRNSPNRRPMYDCTYNAPKSVSLVHAITGDDDIMKAHRDAVLISMAEMEDNMQTQTGQGKDKRYEKTENIIFAEFVHTTSRPNEEELNGQKKFVPDPHLHSHCALINATWFEKEQRYRAIEMGTIKREAPYYEALYHSHLGEELQKAGYEIEKSGKRWEIKGINRELVEKFSNRTMEIEKIAEERGIKDPKAKAELGKLTRNVKHRSVPDSQLHGIWKDRLTPAEYHTIMNAKGGIDPDNGGNGTPPKIGPLADEKEKAKDPTQIITAERAVDLSFAHFLERNSSVSEKRLLAHAIDQSSGRIHPDEIKKEFASRDNILSLTTPHGTKFITTREMHREEETLIETAAKGKSTKPALNPEYEIQNDILNGGQRMAIDYVLGSNDQIIIVSGDAGVGKTTLLSEVKQGVEETGREILAFAPSSDASRNVLQEKGFEDAETIARLLKDEKLQGRANGNVILIDEAGLVGVPTMNKIFDIAEQQNARVVLSGDWKQHSAVEAGDALKLLETKSELRIARVNEIVRQKNGADQQQIVSQMARAIERNNPLTRENGMTKAFDKLDDNGKVIEITDKDERHEKIAQDYLESTSEGEENTLVISPTRYEGKEITEAIRTCLKDSGKIGQHDHEFSKLKSLGFTSSEKQVQKNYSDHDVIEFHQNIKGFKAGSRYLVNGYDNKGHVLLKDEKNDMNRILPYHKHDAFDVYGQEKISLAENDLLRITKNSKSLAGSDLYNKQVYKVTGFDQQGHIKLSNGQVLHKEAHHFDYGYVSTSHGSQGKDARNVLLAQSTFSINAANDKQFYVSISRAQENCRIYTDDKEELRSAVTTNADVLSATEIATHEQQKDNEKQQPSEQMQLVHERLMTHYYDNHLSVTNDNGHGQHVSKERGFEPEK